jgi:protein-L-isoaspartate(D-aspartate) O-methyltransferase
MRLGQRAGVTVDSASDPWRVARERLLDEVRRKVAPRDKRVIEALGKVPRHVFVPESERAHAYDDRALPIGEGQTISQPSMLAIMLDALECNADSRVLEVGAGSGYAAALLAELAAWVDAVEILPDLATRASGTLAALGIKNVRVVVGDGRRGGPDQQHYDRILVSAAPSSVPQALLEALSPGGRIAVPVGDDFGQTLMLGDKDQHGVVHWRRDVACVFVPLVGSGA